MNHCRQALVEEIKASGSIQRHPGVLAAKRWQLWAWGRLRPVHRPHQLEYGARVENSAFGKNFAPCRAALPSNASFPRFQRGDMDHWAIHSDGCLYILHGEGRQAT